MMLMFGICQKTHHLRCTANLFQADNFLVGDVNQLQPLAFMEAAQKAKVPVTFRLELGNSNWKKVTVFFFFFHKMYMVCWIFYVKAVDNH